LLGSCFVLAIVAIFYEALKFARDSLGKTKDNKIQTTNKRQAKLNASTFEMEDKEMRAQKYDEYFRYVFVNKRLIRYRVNREFLPVLKSKNFMWNNSVYLFFLTTKSKMFNVRHYIQTFLHFLQFAVSYFLMLAFMTFNYWLCLSILAGITVGFFVFGVKREKNNLDEECCN